MAKDDTMAALAYVEPPHTFAGRFRHIGPGLISTASIVGSGELIATTVLGAEAGFVALWVILLSCAVKVFVQLEFGKHAIYASQTTMQSFNELPGLRMGRGHWTVWAYVAIMGTKFLQYGGIVGGVALILHLVLPAVSPQIWVILVGLASALTVCVSYYGRIEKAAIIMTGMFTAMTMISLVVVQWTPLAMSGAEVASGLTFQMPLAILAVAIAAFGITGVSADEIVLYPYWCLEKGYGRNAGPSEDSDAWRERVRGWVKVMQVDALFSMLVYTTTTVAFYLLGATILHRQGLVPQGFETVEMLSRIFTDALGPWAMYAFLLGAFATLFSTLFVSVAGWSRVFADAIVLLHGPERGLTRIKWGQIFTFLFPAIWVAVFLFMGRPVLLVIIGGIGTAILLVMLAAVAIYYRYASTPQALRSGRAYDAGLALSVLTIFGVALFTLYRLLP